LLKSPWWVSVVLGVLVFIAMRWAIPAAIAQNPALHPFAVALPRLSPIPLMLFGLFAVASTLFAMKRHRLVDDQTSLEKLRETGWKDFEYLVAEAFRRQGYAVDYSLGRGADGGVDLTLRRDGRTSIVQCKQWKVFSIGAPIIREMFGLMTAEHADEAIIVTTGKFTRDAQAFAAGKPIQLIDGPQLLALVQSVQTNPAATAPAVLRSREREKVPAGRLRDNGDNTNPPESLTMGQDEVSPPSCPSCGQPMVQRTSKRGANAGNQFWGCSTYPACKGTRS
jgi:restriction system protein